MRVKLDYVWLDGSPKNPQLRSKVRIDDLHPSALLSVAELPEWSFDGSSTNQASGHKSDCILKPVRMVKDPNCEIAKSGLTNSYVVLCEVYNADGTPHVTNTRASFEDDPGAWFGFEQEYTLIEHQTGRPVGFPKTGYPRPQGPYYCAVGYANVAGRKVAEELLSTCLKAGIQLTGINAEVMLGQWEYQVFGDSAKLAADDCWLARYFLHKASEKHGLEVSFHPKPVDGDWNGSGMHTNFSTADMRDVGGHELFKNICAKFQEHHQAHINVYGLENEKRLTGLHETQHINSFSYGVSDRGASIRIPLGVAQNGWRGYLEDRRPASNADPYQVVARILETLNS